MVGELDDPIFYVPREAQALTFCMLSSTSLLVISMQLDMERYYKVLT